MPRVPHVQWIGPDAHPGSGNVPSIAYSLVVIAAMKVRLRVLGLGRTLRWIRRREAPAPTTTLALNTFVTACEYSVAMAAALYPGRAMCLERSLALLYLARRAGVPVTYHHGVQPLPFAAHAWVEYESRVINDANEHVNEFLRLPQVCP
jgi:hypothetical protein